MPDAAVVIDRPPSQRGAQEGAPVSRRRDPLPASLDLLEVDAWRRLYTLGRSNRSLGDGSATARPWADLRRRVDDVPPFGNDIGKLLLLAGLAIAVVGGLMLVFGRLGLGSLPGDISGSRGNFTFAIPLGTTILISIVLTVAINIFLRLRH